MASGAKSRSPGDGSSIDEAFPRWYDENSRRYEDLSRVVSISLDSLLKDAGIEFVSISYRLKEKDSCQEKLRRKAYAAPEEMTDLAALRVIAYLQTDVERVCALVAKEFEVLDGLSVDKDIALGIDRVGYRSKHFVCRLGKKRLRLKENARFKDCAFEVQVRTVLQHAWAEIEHDRNYKFSGKLPNDVRRRLNLVAGMLEIADLEFEDITRLISRYQRNVSTLASKGDLNVEINSLSVTEYLASKKYFDDVLIVASKQGEGASAKVIEELASFGAKTLADLDAMITDRFLAAAKGVGGATTANSFLRRAMLYADPDKFFGPKQFRDFRGLIPDTYQLLVGRVGRPKAEALLKSAKIRHMPPGNVN